MPASPMNSAYSDHPKAASTPIEMSVSIVAVAWRRFAHAARWNGHAPHVTTGAASVSDSHCQLSNWSREIIAISTTGSESSAEMTTLCLSPLDSSNAACSPESSTVVGVATDGASAGRAV